MHKSHETLLDCGFKKVAGKNDGKTPITSWLIFLCAPEMRLVFQMQVVRYDVT